MPSEIAVAILGVSAILGAAQEQATQDPASPFGFVYRLPDNWRVLTAKGPNPAQQQKEEEKPSSPEVRRGIACLEVPITARHGDPPATVVVDALPLDCYGQTITSEDLAVFGAGAAEGLKETFDISTPAVATYNLAGHAMWIQRVQATTKGKSAPAYTLETVCTVLARAAVCWVVKTGDDATLKAFEQVPVTLDGARAPRLVPADVWSKPSETSQEP